MSKEVVRRATPRLPRDACFGSAGLDAIVTAPVLAAERSAGFGGSTNRVLLAERELIAGGDALELAALFKMLANDTRVRLLHALVRAGELCVSDLATKLGMAPQAVSNQLQRLADRRIVGVRRDGNRMLYRVIDPCVPVLLDRGLCLTEAIRELGQSGAR